MNIVMLIKFLCLLLPQGTNAHIVLGQAPAAAPRCVNASARWRPRRFWCSTVPHPALRSAVAEAKDHAVLMHADLRTAAFAFLSDCMVKPAPCRHVLAGIWHILRTAAIALLLWHGHL